MQLGQIQKLHPSSCKSVVEMQLGVNTKPSPVARRRCPCNWGEYKTTPLELHVRGVVATGANTKNTTILELRVDGRVATGANIKNYNPQVAEMGVDLQLLREKQKQSTRPSCELMVDMQLGQRINPPSCESKSLIATTTNMKHKKKQKKGEQTPPPSFESGVELQLG